MGFPFPYDTGDDLPVGLGLARRHHDPDRKNPQGIGNRLGPVGRVFTPVEREAVRTPLALAVDVDAADLVDQSINQLSQQIGILPEDTGLLAVI